VWSYGLKLSDGAAGDFFGEDAQRAIGGEEALPVRFEVRVDVGRVSFTLPFAP